MTLRRVIPGLLRKSEGGDSIIPSDVANLEVWYDVTNFASLIFDGSNISQIYDLSGNSRHASQASSGARPLYEATGLNSLPTLKFDGNDFLESTNFNIGSYPLCVFSVIEFVTGATTETPWSYNNNLVTNNYFYASKDVSDLSGMGMRNGGTTVIANVGATGLGGTANILYGSVDAVDLKITDIEESNSRSTVYAYGGLNSFLLGTRRNPAPLAYYNGRLSEVFMYSSIPSISDRQSLFDYLAAKYSITSPTAV